MIPKRDQEAFQIIVEEIQSGNAALLEAKNLEGKQISVIVILNSEYPAEGGIAVIPVAILTPEDLTEVMLPPEGTEVRELTRETVEFHGNNPDCLGHSKEDDL